MLCNIRLFDDLLPSLAAYSYRPDHNEARPRVMDFTACSFDFNTIHIQDSEDSVATGLTSTAGGDKLWHGNMEHRDETRSQTPHGASGTGSLRPVPHGQH
ncbi:unnamed protein product [Lota lota]